MKQTVVKMKGTRYYYLYGVIEGEVSDGINQVHCIRGIKEIPRDYFDIIDDETITPRDVYQANAYKEMMDDRSVYMDIIEQWKCEKAYNRLYKQEIDKRVKDLARTIELMNKGIKYEQMYERP